MIAAIARDVDLIFIWNSLTGRLVSRLADSAGAESLVFSFSNALETFVFEVTSGATLQMVVSQLPDDEQKRFRKLRYLLSGRLLR